MQALWAVLCLAPVLALADGSPAAGLDIWALVGLALWVGGFLVEVVADQQKRTFRDNPANQGRFIQTGLWAISRHPQLFGRDHVMGRPQRNRLSAPNGLAAYHFDLPSLCVHPAHPSQWHSIARRAR